MNTYIELSLFKKMARKPKSYFILVDVNGGLTPKPFIPTVWKGVY